MTARVYSGSIVNPVSFSNVELIENGGVGVNADGTISFLARNQEELSHYMEQQGLDQDSTVALGNRLLIPGLVDTHVHAPQYTFTGTGYGIPLLEWLNRYTFNYESQFAKEEFAKLVYPKAMDRLIRNGTTTAVWFGTIHLEATKILADLAIEKGQRAYVGKVNMDQNSPPHYIEETAASIKDTETFVRYVLDQNVSRVRPIITPRFAPTCTPELMKRLGEIAQKEGVLIQSHISENKDEVKWVAELFPHQNSYAEVYAAHNLLSKNTIMAHGVYLTEPEIDLLLECGAGISHCPLSNICLASGFMNARHLIGRGLSLGLGTDVSGGYSPSILNSMRNAIVASSAIYMERDHSSTPLNHLEAFYLATMGGAQLIGLENQIGNFQVNKDFDALIINPSAQASPFDIFPSDSLAERFEKFCFLGDDRNIEQVFVQGAKV